MPLLVGYERVYGLFCGFLSGKMGLVFCQDGGIAVIVKQDENEVKLEETVDMRRAKSVYGLLGEIHKR